MSLILDTSFIKKICVEINSCNIYNFLKFNIIYIYFVQDSA